MRKINLSDFLVTTDSLSQHQHIRLQNDTLHRRTEPYPSYEFAEFRKNDFYIKVYKWYFGPYKRDINNSSVLRNVVASIFQHSPATGRPRIF